MRWYVVKRDSLNALSGIGGVQTKSAAEPGTSRTLVLMPCRALEAFRLRRGGGPAIRPQGGVLMPCRALEAFRRPGA